MRRSTSASSDGNDGSAVLWDISRYQALNNCAATASSSAHLQDLDGFPLERLGSTGLPPDGNRSPHAQAEGDKGSAPTVRVTSMSNLRRVVIDNSPNV